VVTAFLPEEPKHIGARPAEERRCTLSRWLGLGLGRAGEGGESREIARERGEDVEIAFEDVSALSLSLSLSLETGFDVDRDRPRYPHR